MAKRELDEIEVELSKPTPLSKKQKRLVKKGKIEEPKAEPVLGALEEAAASNEDKTKEKEDAEPKRSKYGVWIGNLPFSVKQEELKEFLVENTLQDLNMAEGITRINLVAAKGFAYVDVSNEKQMQELIKISETQFNGRNMLIKDAKSYEGRPSKAEKESKNPPSRILFVGNLSFDTTDEQIEMLFQHCGTIVKIRTATFQDSGKCKGFTFVDFLEIESATKALNDKRCRKLNGRMLRMEYGEDRSKRRPKHEGEAQTASTESNAEPAAAPKTDAPPAEPRQSYAERKPRVPKPKVGRARPTPGMTLANAVRGRQTVVPSTGKKVTFD